jgi:hypothetical protein
VVNATPRLLYSWERPSVHCIGGWVRAPGPLWTRAENLTSTGIRSPDHPARSESLNDCAIAPEFYNETVEIHSQQKCLKYSRRCMLMFLLSARFDTTRHDTTRLDSGRFGPRVTPCQRPCMVSYSDCGCFKCYLFHCTTAWRLIYFVCIYITLHYITSVKYFNIWLSDIYNFISFLLY